MGSRRNYHVKRRQQKKIMGWLMLAGGLLLLGVAAIFIIPESDTATAAPAIQGIPAPANVEYPAPELVLSDLQGDTQALANYRGKVVLVNLWATWCPPCKQEMPDLQAYYDAHVNDGFVIIAINDGDPEEDVAAFVQDYGLTFPVWLDPTYVATEKAFRAPGLPSTYVIDREGIVRLVWSGGLNFQALEKYVTPLLDN